LLQNRPRKPEGGVGIQIYSSFNLDAKWEWVINATSQPLYIPPLKNPVGIVQEGG